MSIAQIGLVKKKKKSSGEKVLVFDCELANAVKGITLSLSNIETFTQFKGYYAMLCNTSLYDRIV